MKAKLTAAQTTLLKTLATTAKGHYVADSYVPGKRLIALGYAEAHELRFGSMLTITPAGRAALEQGGQS